MSITEKKLYALTDEHVEVLKAWADYGLSISMDHKELGETADASHALTPLDTDAAVERMARALAESLHGGDFWDDYEDDGSTLIINREGYRSDARAALAALLGGEQS